MSGSRKCLGFFISASFAIGGCNVFVTSQAAHLKSSNYVQPRSSTTSLARFLSATKMEQYIKEGIKKATTDASTYAGWYPPAAVGPTNTGVTPGVASGGSSTSQQTLVFSTTNLQEAGVDESDLLKSDGTHAYVAVVNTNLPIPLMAGAVAPGTGPSGAGGGVATGGTVVIGPPIPGTPSDDAAFLARYANSIRVMNVSAAPPSASEISVIRPADQGFYIRDFFLLTQRANGLPDMLAVTATTSGSPYAYWFSPWYWGASSTGVYLVNVADPANPTSTKKITFDGNIISSRRIGETIYVVSRFMPSIPGYQIYPATATDVSNNAALLNAATLPDLLPSLSIDGVKVGPLVSADNCYLPPTPDDNIATPTIITITAINMQTPDSPASACIIGDSETVYASTDSIYLATTRYQYSPAPLPGGSGSGTTTGVGTGTVTSISVGGGTTTPPVTVAAPTIIAVYPSPDVSTDVHKFKLDSSPPSYCCSGNVAGHLGWEQDKKSFRMGEQNGYLRIATSVGQTWDSTASTLLTVLGETPSNGTTALGQVAQLPNPARPEPLGKTGEQLYAARFVGNRAYLVTFLLTDPLYIIDLSNPADPYIAGQLQTAGFSDYLQLVGDNFLLGIGKDATPDATGAFGDGRGAWYQGLKLSLFDITDPANPREAGKVVIGKRGTDSDALVDHRAITYLPAAGNNPARLAIPVMLNDTVPTYSGFDPSQPWAYYDWTNTGLYLFEMNTTSGGTISQLGKLITQTPSATTTYDWADGNSRSLIVNDSVHFVKGGRVWSGSWSATPYRPVRSN